MFVKIAQLDPPPTDEDAVRRPPTEETIARGASELQPQATTPTGEQQDRRPRCIEWPLDETESEDEVELQCLRLPSRVVEYQSVVPPCGAVHCSARGCRCPDGYGRNTE